jgi:xylose isomerase
MMAELKLCAIVGLYNQMSDRFMTGGYAQDRDMLALVDVACKQGLVRGLEFVGGIPGGLNRDNLSAVQGRLRDTNVAIAAVNPNLWGDKRWGRGTVGANDAATRVQALDYIKTVIDLAAEAGCDLVNLWPGQDGYDYYFEVDYQRVYEWWVSGMQTLADHNPQVRLGLEFKPYEPRATSFISTSAKTLLLLEDIDRANVGVCFDVGHSLYAHENLAEVVALSQRKGKLFHLHMNDNYGNWDWDLNVGSVHFLAYIEFMYWLNRTNFDGWYSMDIFSYRMNPEDSMYESLMWTKGLHELVESLGRERLDALLQQGDPIAASRMFRELLLQRVRP